MDALWRAWPCTCSHMPIGIHMWTALLLLLLLLLEQVFFIQNKEKKGPLPPKKRRKKKKGNTVDIYNVHGEALKNKIKHDRAIIIVAIDAGETRACGPPVPMG